jgi:hypothetical protein
MRNYALKDIDSLDIDDLLFKIEGSFAIRFTEYELRDVTTFGQLCDRITDKILLQDTGDSTSQQAFYKLREAMVSAWQADRKAITPDAPIAPFLPRRKRRFKVQQLEDQLGFKLYVLRPPHWLKNMFGILLLISIGMLALNVLLGIAGLIISVAGFLYVQKMGIELDQRTLGDLAKNMMRTNYAAARRNPRTFNKQEIHKVLTDWFSDALNLNKNKLGRDAALR